MSEIQVEIGYETGGLAELADWHDLMSALVSNGCECELRAKPGAPSKGSEVLIELLIMSPLAKGVLNALTAYYQTRHNARIKLKNASREIEISGVSTPEAMLMLEEFAREDDES